ncbi:MAG: glycine zipper 2TM domain-containing protein [Trinickia sp.]|uniref:glycine zipper 2TM domain-containing protein n=1 Tax=Trinickia sp. TaxID=2571163 RepID=UPI003F7E3916
MNEPSTSPRRLHPLIAVAAGTVIVASLAATAAITGVFPKASSSSAANDQSQTAQVAPQPVVDSAAPATAAAMTGQQAPESSVAAPAAQSQNPPQSPGQLSYTGQPGQPSYAQPQPYRQPPAQQQQWAQQPYAQPQQRAEQPAYCASCGTVESVVPIRHEGHGTGIGAVGGAVVGGLLGNQFGGGSGRLGMTALGAVGGGFAGNAVEKHLRSTTAYQVRVRMENGRLRYFTYRQAPAFQQGERVRIEHGALVAG